MTARQPIPLTSEADRWRTYEAAKSAWDAEHPTATPAEYEAAMRRIAKELGI